MTLFYSFKAKLHKVEINKTGGHFVKHRDSEKDKSIFGTLIIQPPSSHTGGELVVYEANGKSKKVIDFGQKEKKSKFSVQFAAHNADLQHELLEVKSGYRVALVYSLYLIRGYFNTSFITIQLKQYNWNQNRLGMKSTFFEFRFPILFKMKLDFFLHLFTLH